MRGQRRILAHLRATACRPTPRSPPSVRPSPVPHPLSPLSMRVLLSDSLRDASLSEVFDLRTSGLPHFNYQRREFAAKAEALSRSFLDPSRRDFVFRRRQQQESGNGEGAEAVEAVDDPEEAGGGRRRQQQQQHGVVPLSMLRQRLEGIWASASTNGRLSEVRVCVYRVWLPPETAACCPASQIVADVRAVAFICGKLFRFARMYTPCAKPTRSKINLYTEVSRTTVLTRVHTK